MCACLCGIVEWPLVTCPPFLRKQSNPLDSALIGRTNETQLEGFVRVTALPFNAKYFAGDQRFEGL